MHLKDPGRKSWVSSPSIGKQSESGTARIRRESIDELVCTSEHGRAGMRMHMFSLSLSFPPSILSLSLSLSLLPSPSPSLPLLMHACKQGTRGMLPHATTTTCNLYMCAACIQQHRFVPGCILAEKLVNGRLNTCEPAHAGSREKTDREFIGRQWQADRCRLPARAPALHAPLPRLALLTVSHFCFCAGLPWMLFQPVGSLDLRSLLKYCRSLSNIM